MRYFITLCYDGTRYHGWQVQPNGISVQGELQHALSVLLRQEIVVTGAGRTDAGVHARMMVAHFNVETPVDPKQLCYKLNRMLPQDIAIQLIESVDDNLHARYSAVARTYHYYVHICKSPFHRHYSWQVPYPLDFDAMNRAAQLLLEYDDFAAFCKSHTDVKTTFCKVMRAEWVATANDAWYFEITANRFLRNMVRAIVGTLVEVGRGRMTIDDFRRVIEGKRRSDAGESMPGNALFLEKIDY